jgi:hypothetical protein
VLEPDVWWVGAIVMGLSSAAALAAGLAGGRALLRAQRRMPAG